LEIPIAGAKTKIFRISTIVIPPPQDTNPGRGPQARDVLGAIRRHPDTIDDIILHHLLHDATDQTLAFAQDPATTFPHTPDRVNHGADPILVLAMRHAQFVAKFPPPVNNIEGASLPQRDSLNTAEDQRTNHIISPTAPHHRHVFEMYHPRIPDFPRVPSSLNQSAFKAQRLPK